MFKTSLCNFSVKIMAWLKASRYFTFFLKSNFVKRSCSVNSGFKSF